MSAAGGMSVPPHVWAELDRIQREGERQEDVDRLTSLAKEIRCFYCLDNGVCYRDRESMFANLDGNGDYDIVTCPSCASAGAEGGFVVCSADPEEEVAGILKRGDRERMFWEGSPAEGTSVVAALGRKIGIAVARGPAPDGRRASAASSAPQAEEAASASSGEAESAAAGTAEEDEAESAAADEEDDTLRHPLVTCDGCGAGPPLTGRVMTCSVCWDFDLCWRCYPTRETLGHPHDHGFEVRHSGGLQFWGAATFGGWSVENDDAAQVAEDEAAARAAEAAATDARAAEALARCARVPWSLCLRANVRGGLKGGGEMECALCLDEYKEGDSLLRLACGHFFHEDCVGLWLHKTTVCPMCKQDV